MYVDEILSDCDWSIFRRRQQCMCFVRQCRLRAHSLVCLVVISPSGNGYCSGFTISEVDLKRHSSSSITRYKLSAATAPNNTVTGHRHLMMTLKYCNNTQHSLAAVNFHLVTSYHQFGKFACWGSILKPMPKNPNDIELTWNFLSSHGMEI